MPDCRVRCRGAAGLEPLHANSYLLRTPYNFQLRSCYVSIGAAAQRNAWRPGDDFARGDTGAELSPGRYYTDCRADSGGCAGGDDCACAEHDGEDG